MFTTTEEQIAYIKETYPEITDYRIDANHWDLNCAHCKTTRGFQVISTTNTNNNSLYTVMYGQAHVSPVAIYFRCPVCQTYKQWIVYIIPRTQGNTGKPHYYRVASLPSEGIEDIEEIPSEPKELRIAYKQAIRAMDANAHIAAAAMFRRALQVITRNILGAKPGNLASELKSVVGKTFNGATIVNNFAEVGYIVKEAGNQGAHPDSDPDLLDFSEQDARDLQAIFMEIITDIFVVPAAMKRTRDEFLKRRKISP